MASPAAFALDAHEGTIAVERDYRSCRFNHRKMNGYQR
jgi:hypothetical protein